MKDKYQLLLHIGLPKTASTSLQNNLLYGLHKERKINFLGKSEGVGRRGFFSNPEIVTMLTAKKLTKEELCKIQKKMEKLLTHEKLNVLSEETLSVSMSYDVEAVLHNLKTIFQKCDIKILISLRSPVDMLFSVFIEDYPWLYYADENRNTFEKFGKRIVRNFTDIDYLQFKYEAYLNLVDQYFGDKTVLLFEDLKYDQNTYFSTLSHLLGIEKDEANRLFLSSVQHSKKVTTIGKKSKGYTVLNALLKITPNKHKHKLKEMWLIRLLRHITISKPVEHLYPDIQISALILNTFGIKNIDKFSKEYRLNKDKLVQYNYSLLDQ